ncbi:OmpA family protein [Luteimonas sp. RIT-PG2_3]
MPHPARLAVPIRATAALLVLLSMTACQRTPEADAAASASVTGATAATDAAAGDVDGVQTSAVRAEAGTAGDGDFPAIPQIVIPEIVGIGPAQRALQASMQDIIDPVAGVSIKPANCATDGALVNDAGITSVDAQGNLTRNGDEGIFRIDADGTGTANYEGGIITINADGSGTINGNGSGGGDDGIIAVEADGAGSYNGPDGIISLDGRGAGTWNGDHGIISNHGDGSGTWNGPQGLVTINADGSGTWNGPQGLVRNHGDGSGEVGTPSRTVAMAPIPKVLPAGRFPPLRRFAPPGAPCGVLITLNDQVLFDFDKSEIRPDAAKVLDVLASALKQVEARQMDIRGHTDAKGSDAYNLELSDRRAQSVVAALRQRGAAQTASAKGYGEAQPVAPNEVDGQDNPAGRQLNRRVEIFLRT